MRTLTILGALALTAGACTATDSDLQYRGTLDIKTDGIALFDDGQAGHAAMNGTTCLVNPDGGVADDIDLDGSDDTVIDVTGSDEGGMVLARTRDTLHIMEPMDISGFNMEPESRSLPLVGVTDGRLVQGGIVALADCDVSFMDLQGEVISTQQLDVIDCTGMGTGFDVDRVNQVAYAANAQGIAAVTSAGAVRIADGADVVAWSPDANALMVATRGQSGVRALEADGTPRWNADVAGTVHDVADLGARGGVAVVVESDGGGVLAILDSQTGALQRSFDLPGVAEIVTSANGQTIALVLPNAVHYYNLR